MRLVLALALGVIGTLLVQLVLLAPPPARPHPPADFDVELRLSEPFLGQLVRDELQRSQLGESLRDLHVDAQIDGRLHLAAQASLLGIQAPLLAVLEPRVTDNQIRVEAVAAELGGLGLPPELLASLEASLNESLQRIEREVPLRIVGVGTDEQSLVVRLER